MKRLNIFNCEMDSFTMDETISEIERRLDGGLFTQHVVVNVAKIVKMQKDAQLAASIRECDIVNIDGMGVVWGARMLGNRVPERVAGVDLFERLLKLSELKGYPVYLLGGTDIIVDRVAKTVLEKYRNIKIVGYSDGYFWSDELAVVNKIRNSGARLLFVAITSPKKEDFINKWKNELGVEFVMGVGGTFDVIAGKVQRAPGWMQRSGLEWLYRVIQEPRRMWKRYLITNTQFLFMLGRAYLFAGRR